MIYTFFWGGGNGEEVYHFLGADVPIPDTQQRLAFFKRGRHNPL